MINPAIMQLRMELTAVKKEYNENELRLKRLIAEIQMLANPYYKTIQSIKAEELEQSADELLALKKVMLEQTEKINDIKAQLGEADFR